MMEQIFQELWLGDCLNLLNRIPNDSIDFNLHRSTVWNIRSKMGFNSFF